ncbi:MAG: VacB/RNase II family 3'-5' exoribonuclease, partial [Candidatus Competibacteraceae bacterium]|nr:VacB/RNase II family 3'-5' exoribonuclease [Candidatus Competibacteraceae bacterium]
MSKAKRKGSWHKLDPHYQQEKEKYGQAAPSRAFITQTLEEQGVPMSYEMLRDHLGIDDEWESEALRRRLKAMERDGDLIRNRRGGYGVVAKMDLVRGKVIGHPEGFGFLVPEEGGADLYISPRQMRQLLHGDRVVMRVAGVDRRGRKEGALVEILERTTQQVVGRFFKQRGFGFVVPDNRRVHQDILVPQEYQNKAKDNQIVVAELIEQPSKISPPIGRIREVLGEHLAPGMEVQIALYSHDIPHEWPEEVKKEAGRVQKEVAEEDKAGRLDLRELPLVTIDGITARDFDDAVYCEKRGKNYRLIVAIADVSHYVKPGMALDGEAHTRGTSVYFPDRVIPMLPEVLSNGLCSLNPKVDRLCMVCDMTLNPEGKIVRSRFHEGVMRSHARLTYDAVAAMVVDKDERLRKEYQGLVKHLDRLYELFHILHEARGGRGAIDFETQETVIEYGPDRKIERIVPSSRNDAHRIIEECMITANVAAARYLQRHKMPTLYRV